MSFNTTTKAISGISGIVNQYLNRKQVATKMNKKI